MKVAVGCDHGGLVLKSAVVEAVKEMNYEVEDFGAFSEDSVDYPDYALKVAEAVARGESDCGVLLCGTGIGISIAANKVKGIRAAVVTDEFCAKACKQHNNANVLAMGGRVISPELAAKLVKAWLSAEFCGDRHSRRLDKIAQIEEKYMK